MLRRIALCVGMIACFTTSLYAAPRQLTMDEAINIALKQNKKIQLARLNVQKADAAVTEALGNALPSVNVGASYNRNIQAPVFFIPDFQNPSSGVLSPVRISLNNSYNINAQIQQVIFNSAVFTGIGASKIYTDAAKAQLQATTAEVITETKKSFYGAMLAQSMGTIAKATLDNTQQTMNTIETLFKEGMVAEFDLIRVQVALENVRPMVTEADASYETAIAALQTQIGMPMTDSIIPVGQFGEDLASIPSDDEAMVLALKNNPDLIALQLQVDVAREFIDVYRSDYYPTLAAFGQWQNQGQSDNFSGWVAASSTVVGLNLSLNLFNGRKTSSKVDQATISYETARETYNQVADLTRLGVVASLHALRSARQRIDAQRSTVRQAERGLDIANIRYKEGTGSLLEISDAEAALSRTRVNRIQALYDYYVRSADYERSTGAIDPKYMQTSK